MFRVLVASLVSLLAAPAVGQFDSEVRPLLSEYCFHCHGPDDATRKARLRLDTEAGLFGARNGRRPVVPGQPDASEIIRRITSENPKKRMPPASTHRTLSTKQVSILKDWIRGGAKWKRHWAFDPPVRPAEPQLLQKEWPTSTIDRFVLARLEEQGWRPNPAASKRALLRRVTLDLTGLPPTPKELASFLADRREDAFEAVVDRLLASPRYGERMAWEWLEAGRYADTNGYQNDATRTMWPYRDWVVEAFNKNLPFDDFLVWQLAGDLLPDPTFEQRLATAFCRNHMINGEGGRIAEENRVEYVLDQTETVGTVALGLTVGCARCHNHKYDPLSQREYYQLSAFFNQTPVTGAGGNPQTAPTLTVRRPADRQRVAELEQRVSQLAKERDARAERLASPPAVALWEARVRGMFVPLQPASARSLHGQDLSVQKNQAVLARGKNPVKDTYLVSLDLPPGTYTGIRLDALRHESMTAGGLARSDSGNFVLTEIECAVCPDAGRPRPISIDSAVATFEQPGYPVSRAWDGDANTGWAVHRGRPVQEAHAAVFRFASPLVVVDAKLDVKLSFSSRHARHNLGYFRLSVTSGPKPELFDGGAVLALATPPQKRTEPQRVAIARALARQDPKFCQLERRHETALAKLTKLRKSTGRVRVMVMADQSKKRRTYLLRRGVYSNRGPEVEAAVPGFLGRGLPKGSRNRLALARWLTNPEHPLTSRVTVNRQWAKFFGTGLVETLEDFGAQGAKPSHPKLLDWLAIEFVRSGWDVKVLHRRIVTSATYRQAAAVTSAKFARDPANRFLARGPRYRLPSYAIRDLALSVSGLLVDKRGGPSVRPYQPSGVWAEATFGKTKYRPGKGEELYRRSLYTFWRRIVGPTVFFDVAKRQTCEVRTMRTNTPMHALLTLNDVTYVEAARSMAQRVLLRLDLSERARLAYAFELATSRVPSDKELDVLTGRLAALRGEYRGRVAKARELLAIGSSARNPAIPPAEHAAWTGICSLILNLDETLNK